MNRSLFYYELPEERIAQTPIKPRDHSKLMRLNRVTGEIEHTFFYDIASSLKRGDLLVVNNSKVIPARLNGKKEGSGANVEVLLLRELEYDCWECAVRPGKKLHEGACIRFADSLSGEITGTFETGNREIRFLYDDSFDLYALLNALGTTPLPHYIKAPIANPDDYQTVYAKYPGSAAAPTAGFHFTSELIEEISRMGVGLAELTLHVGLGTFRPVKTETIEEHFMHTEYYTISEETAALINRTKENGGRIIAVGTTTCRTLEAAYRYHNKIKPCDGKTDIFIYPGYEFKAIDALITNFHLPESTLIMLVAAFAGYDNTMRAYETAIKENYRFYSFGDAMLIY